MLAFALFMVGVVVGSVVTAILIWDYQVECEVIDDDL